MNRLIRFATVFAILLTGAVVAKFAFADAGHAHGAKHTEGAKDDTEHMLEQMRELHKGHEHGHDFEAIEAMKPEDVSRVIAAMQEIGLAVPPMDSHHGRELFVDKGCIVCHAVNGVGGEIGPSFNAADMPSTMSTFEFAARMWRGAGAMVEMQEELLGEQIELSGQDLADLIAFVHDADEQKELGDSDIPERYKALME